MDKYWQSVADAAGFLKEKIGGHFKLGLITGTGLGKSLSSLGVTCAIDYADIPGFPVSTVTGHAGRLLAGSLAGKPVLAMDGRLHLYEGYTPQMVSFPVRVMQAMGVRMLILTNAAGGLNPDFSSGDIMVIRDHINMTGENPLAGPNNDKWGIRFPDMSAVYSPAIAEMALQAAGEMGISLKQGVYVGVKGPSLETPAETRFYRMIGADAIGMSTIQEVIAAVHGGMNVLGLSTITNVNDPDVPIPAMLEDIIRTAENAAETLSRIITAVAGKMDNECH
jgi:purine-nucleoside phosphorylase